ncbi:MAG: hypothetical protein R3E66_02685 [bacterium]
MAPKFESPHSELQSILPWLAALSGKRITRPAFRTVIEAQLFAQARKNSLGVAPVVQPIWAVDHNDLTASETIGWTVSDSTN